MSYVVGDLSLFILGDTSPPDPLAASLRLVTGVAPQTPLLIVVACGRVVVDSVSPAGRLVVVVGRVLW